VGVLVPWCNEHGMLLWWQTCWLWWRALRSPHGDGARPRVIERWPHKGPTSTAAVVGVGVIVTFLFPFTLALVVATIVGIGVGGRGLVEELDECC
jgi:hypothetical protein